MVLPNQTVTTAQMRVKLCAAPAGSSHALEILLHIQCQVVWAPYLGAEACNCLEQKQTVEHGV